ncbi:MAG: transcription-repair coupling factor, partial [Calditrichaeota bacterium]
EVDDVLQQFPNASIVMACDSDGQRDRLRELFFQEDFPHYIHISTLNLSSGFSWPAEKLFIYTSRELYSRVRLPKLDKLIKRPVSFREQSSMHRGDYVVHTDYGIGIFQGLEKIRAYGKVRECLTIEYLDGDKVYVPLEKMDQVQKYSAAEEGVPALSKLGSINWEKLKERTKQRMKEIAGELIGLYAARRMQEGYAFAEDTVWQNELEASFQFEETIDQLNAIRDVKFDLAASRPMDRLVCGDVGYGKTEVAVRAAFKVVTDGKQVAVLVPTTILAQQHFMTFSERMKNFPVRIEMISRFKSPKEQKEIIEKLQDGKIDLIIGTHRLLSKDVKFKDIGLLVVDEEQRFGVMHKENIKLIKNSVDTLTLSATPIPRTMHMALMGAKDMSIINSPPNNRRPIKTEVSRFDRDLIREAVLKEIDRGGQVFFVHNRVQSIYGMASLVRDIVPEASVAVAHGQMKGHELEKVMLKFLQGAVQVLVCTMIIENGIDMPHANTLIINRADKFGLAQLYQLRGRVGRSDQQAYAYLIIPPMRRLSHDAIRRLQTIQENSELGAGYKIAMRDLEIRGAGNIFGAEQTGFVNALGFDLYTRIIKEAIREIRKEKNLDVEEVEEEPTLDAKVECAVDAYLPEDYISSTAERVDVYRRLVQASKPQQIQNLQKELVDRFGELPEKAQNLFDYMIIKMLASKAKLSKLVLKDQHLTGEFDYQNLPAGEEFKSWLHKLVQAVPKELALRQENDQLVFELFLTHGKSLLKEAKNVLQRII